MRIGIDAMGGDHAPEEIVRGGIEGLKFLGPEDRLVFIGREDDVQRFLPESPDSRIDIVHTPEVIAMDDSPVESLRQKRKSSIVVMATMAASGELDAVISAGNTGACAAACQLRMKALGPVLRPGIAVVLPTFAGPLTICDAGANVSPKPVHLLQYAQMACAYSSEILGIENPRVGLISVGGEDVKGSPLVKKTNELLRNDPSIEFVGNVEGRELFSGACEVGVCDGFVGNVVLKLTEGLAEGLFKTIGRETKLESEELFKRVEPIFGRIWERHDYSEYGGAPLLGVNGSCIICHGSSGRRAIFNAVRIAADSVNKNLNRTILSRISEVSPDA